VVGRDVGSCIEMRAGENIGAGWRAKFYVVRAEVEYI
jgi:hypothetical protein